MNIWSRENLACLKPALDLGCTEQSARLLALQKLWFLFQVAIEHHHSVGAARASKGGCFMSGKSLGLEKGGWASSGLGLDQGGAVSHSWSRDLGGAELVET